MHRLLLLIVACALTANAQNLLKNPSFESSSSNEPNDWKVFVQPKYDASSLLDQRVAKDGTNSLRLSIATPYAEDPANNWSQNILQDLRGKHLVAKGYIKTEDAGEAAIWVQCYRKQPVRVVLQESSTAKKLVTGTQDWTPVEFLVHVPTDTDFIVVRCVLRGHGTAWFDDLSLKLNAELTAANAAAGAAAASMVPQEALAPALPEVKMPAPPVPPEMPKMSGPSADQAKALLQAQEEMRKANQALQQSNAALTQQVTELRKQIEDLKKQVGETAAEAKRLKDEQVPMERDKSVEVPAPPLIPGDQTERNP